MAINKKTGLGRGLDALISGVETGAAEKTENNGVFEAEINKVEPNMGQPRKYFDNEKITELSESIKKHGIIQPLIVTKDGEIYRIIAGERRWRAAKQAGLKAIPVVLKEVTPKEHMELAIIENIQREDLNPLEEAEAYERLRKDHNMTQEQIAESVGKSRPAIANAVRLLSLSEKVKRLVMEGSISAGHARCLAAIKEEKVQDEIAEVIISKVLNVRQTEEYIKKMLSEEPKQKKEIRKEENTTNKIELKHIEKTLRELFNTKVSLKDENDKGKIEIEYFSAEERERILDVLWGNK